MVWASRRLSLVEEHPTDIGDGYEDSLKDTITCCASMHAHKRRKSGDIIGTKIRAAALLGWIRSNTGRSIRSPVDGQQGTATLGITSKRGSKRGVKHTKHPPKEKKVWGKQHKFQYQKNYLPLSHSSFVLQPPGFFSFAGP